MDMDQGFWLRGMMVQAWTAVPPPTDTESWTATGINEVPEGILG